jgi:hypothetical protein
MNHSTQNSFKIRIFRNSNILNKMLILICMGILYLSIKVSSLYAQPYAQAFDQEEYPVRLQQKFFPYSDAYITFSRQITTAINKQIKQNLPKSIVLSEKVEYQIYAIYRYDDLSPTSKKPAQRLGWIYLNDYPSSQGILRVVWAFDLALKIKGYEILDCRMNYCDLLHQSDFIDFMRGQSDQVLLTYITEDGDHLRKRLPRLELPAQALGLALIHSALVSIRTIPVLWPRLFNLKP